MSIPTGGMLITTTNTLEGKRILRYLGLVSGEAILGANLFKDFFAGIRDIVGGRSGAYEKELRRAKEIALAEMTQQAREMGANAVIGVDLDYETLGSDGGMLMVTAAGTAIVFEDPAKQQGSAEYYLGQTTSCPVALRTYSGTAREPFQAKRRSHGAAGLQYGPRTTGGRQEWIFS